MKDEKHYKSDAFAAIYESADALHQIGATDKKAMHGLDEFYLTPITEVPAHKGCESRARPFLA